MSLLGNHRDAFQTNLSILADNFRAKLLNNHLKAFEKASC